jgi:hypothetical protein
VTQRTSWETSLGECLFFFFPRAGFFFPNRLHTQIKCLLIFSSFHQQLLCAEPSLHRPQAVEGMHTRNRSFDGTRSFCSSNSEQKPWSHKLSSQRPQFSFHAFYFMQGSNHKKVLRRRDKLLKLLSLSRKLRYPNRKAYCTLDKQTKFQVSLIIFCASLHFPRKTSLIGERSGMIS